MSSSSGSVSVHHLIVDPYFPPVQGYADDAEVSSRDKSVLHNMLARTDEFLHWSKLEVKHTKCAAQYERRSGGNRWYKAKSDKPPSFTIMGQPIRVYSCH